MGGSGFARLCGNGVLSKCRFADRKNGGKCWLPVRSLSRHDARRAAVLLLSWGADTFAAGLCSGAMRSGNAEIRCPASLVAVLSPAQWERHFTLAIRQGRAPFHPLAYRFSTRHASDPSACAPMMLNFAAFIRHQLYITRRNHVIQTTWRRLYFD